MIVRKISENGFTLIELLVVITIIIILGSIAFPVYSGVQERARAAQDMSNLRQLGLATQMYENDNDGVLFATSSAWMTQLHPKYLGAWKIFQSPFDTRAPSENDTGAPISYGVNGNTGVVGMSTDKITNPSGFIVFAPAQDAGTSVKFSGLPGASVTVYKAGVAQGGTFAARTRINALFADGHSESMLWKTFINDQTTSTDPRANLRWDPYTPYP